MMEVMAQEHGYVLKVLSQMVERREIRNGIHSAPSGK